MYVDYRFKHDDGSYSNHQMAFDAYVTNWKARALFWTKLYLLHSEMELATVVAIEIIH